MGNTLNFSPSMDRGAAEELVEKYRQLWANEIESGRVQMATVEQFLAKTEEVRVGIDPMKSPIEKILAIADDDPRRPELERANGGMPISKLKENAAALKEMFSKINTRRPLYLPRSAPPAGAGEVL
jgi:hypothetical protein